MDKKEQNLETIIDDTLPTTEDIVGIGDSIYNLLSNIIRNKPITPENNRTLYEICGNNNQALSKYEKEIAKNTLEEANYLFFGIPWLLKTGVKGINKLYSTSIEKYNKPKDN